jgi:hypothetical protein
MYCRTTQHSGALLAQADTKAGYATKRTILLFTHSLSASGHVWLLLPGNAHMLAHKLYVACWPHMLLAMQAMHNH